MTKPTMVLVVEPHENLRDAYASVLRFAGYRVDEAWCGVSAREQLQAARPKLVLLNVQLPTVEDALLLLRRSRSQVALHGITWVALSRSDVALSGAQQAEFDAVLRTPVTYSELLGLASVFTMGEPAPFGTSGAGSDPRGLSGVSGPTNGLAR